MKTIFLLAAVLAFAGYSQAARATKLPVKVFENAAESSITVYIAGTSITIPGAIKTLIPTVLDTIAAFQAAPIPYISVDTTIDATLKTTDNSFTLSALGVNLNVPARTLDPIRSILEVVLNVIAPLTTSG